MRDDYVTNAKPLTFLQKALSANKRMRANELQIEAEAELERKFLISVPYELHATLIGQDFYLKPHSHPVLEHDVWNGIGIDQSSTTYMSADLNYQTGDNIRENFRSLGIANSEIHRNRDGAMMHHGYTVSGRDLEIAVNNNIQLGEDIKKILSDRLQTHKSEVDYSGIDNFITGVFLRGEKTYIYFSTDSWPGGNIEETTALGHVLPGVTVQDKNENSIFDKNYEDRMYRIDTGKTSICVDTNELLKALGLERKQVNPLCKQEIEERRKKKKTENLMAI